jgi:hypothetical protein
MSIYNVYKTSYKSKQYFNENCKSNLQQKRYTDGRTGIKQDALDYNS